MTFCSFHCWRQPLPELFHQFTRESFLFCRFAWNRPAGTAPRYSDRSYNVAEPLSTSLAPTVMVLFATERPSQLAHARAEEDGRKPRSSERPGWLWGPAIPISPDVLRKPRTISHLGHRPTETGHAPRRGLFPVGALSSMFSARAVLDGVSLTIVILSEPLSPFLSLALRRRPAPATEAAPFDGEGTPPVA